MYTYMAITKFNEKADAMNLKENKEDLEGRKERAE